jgi:hypothetical protein
MRVCGRLFGHKLPSLWPLTALVVGTMTYRSAIGVLTLNIAW